MTKGWKTQTGFVYTDPVGNFRPNCHSLQKHVFVETGAGIQLNPEHLNKI
ncbi:MAG: hypothetical protein OXJ52_05990 [Oligoflexia bacterium]|nr:hypothetical protein [Oligoflexia bacterium]